MSAHNSKKSDTDVELAPSFGTITKLSNVEFVKVLTSINQDEEVSDEEKYEVYATGGY